VVFDYTPTRERAGPEKFLEDFQGYLQADAYVAYDSFFTDPERGLVEVACWAHYLETGIIQGAAAETALQACLAIKRSR